MSDRLEGSDAKPTDVEFLLRLSQVQIDLHRYREASANTTACLQQRRVHVLKRKTLLRGDSVALANARNTNNPDQLTIDIPQEAVGGSDRLLQSATRHEMRSTDALLPLLARLSETIAALEREADDLRTGLSIPGKRAFDALARKNTLPI